MMYLALLAGSSRFTWVRPSQPRRIPMTCMSCSLARYTTFLMTAFRPGTSPPPVKIPMRLVDIKSPDPGWLPLIVALERVLGRNCCGWLWLRYCSLQERVRHFRPATPNFVLTPKQHFDPGGFEMPMANQFGGLVAG